MATNDTLMLSVIGTNLGQQHIHTLHFREGLTATGPAQLITLWKTSCRAAYVGCFHATHLPVQLIKAEYVCGALPLPAGAENVPIAGDQAGFLTATGDPSPSFLSSLTILRGTLKGRSRQGKYFIGGSYEVDVTGQTFAASYITQLQAYAAALTATFITPLSPDYRLVVHSRKLAAVPGTDCVVSSTPVGALVVSDRVTTMRSRKLGHGI